MSMSGSSSGYAIDNLTYDLITIIHEKSQALEAYDKYIQDAQSNPQVAQLLQQIRQQDQQTIQQLMQHLGQTMGSSSSSGGMSQQGSGGI
jgi:Mg/Co/Ni transporter MgtE